MKFGIHLITLMNKWNDNLLELVKLAKKIGFEGVEVPILDLDSFPQEELKKLKEKINIEILCGTGLSEETDISSPILKRRKKGVDYLKRCIEIASAISSPQLGGVLYAPWGKASSIYREKGRRETAIESMREVCKFAKKSKIILAIEPLNRYETSFINTVDEGIDFIQKVGSESLKLHLDTFHMNIEEKNLESSFEKAKDYFFHFHVGENNRSLPGFGNLNWQLISKYVRNIGYSRWVVIESLINYPCEIASEANTWRILSKDKVKDLRKSLNFLRSVFSAEEPRI